MAPFDSYMLNKVRRLKDVRIRSAATGEGLSCQIGTDGVLWVDMASAASFGEGELWQMTGRRRSSGSSTAKARRCSRRTPSSASCDSAAEIVI